MDEYANQQSERAIAISSKALMLANEVSNRFTQADAVFITDLAEMMFWTGYGNAAAASIFYADAEHEIERASGECKKLLDAIATLRDVRTVM